MKGRVWEMGSGEYVDAAWHRWWVRFFVRLDHLMRPGRFRGTKDLARVSEEDLERVARWVDRWEMKCPDLAAAVARVVMDRRGVVGGQEEEILTTDEHRCTQIKGMEEVECG